MVPNAHSKDFFATTHWSIVQLAARIDTVRAQHALAVLCEKYWYPLYAYVRRRGHNPDDAQDLTQEFFARLLRAEALASVTPAKGKFRTFLLASMNHFLANEWDRVHASKRGGGVAPISFDAVDPEERYRMEPVDNVTAEKIFERRWTLELLDRVLKRLRTDYEQAGKAALFDSLKVVLTMGKGAVPLAQLAAELGMTEGAVKVAALRLRERYRAMLVEEVAQTVSNEAEVEEEIRYLFSTLTT